MKKIETRLPGVYIIEPQVFGDQRGYFMEIWSTRNFEELGLNYHFVQDNQSFSAQKGTLRGIHFQNAPMAQAKLVRVTRGAVLDVAVDLRKGSPTYRQWLSVELSAENKRMLMIPRGFGHGFRTLTDDVEFCYKVDNGRQRLQLRLRGNLIPRERAWLSGGHYQLSVLEFVQWLSQLSRCLRTCGTTAS